MSEEDNRYERNIDGNIAATGGVNAADKSRAYLSDSGIGNVSLAMESNSTMVSSVDTKRKDSSANNERIPQNNETAPLTVFLWVHIWTQIWQASPTCPLLCMK